MTFMGSGEFITQTIVSHLIKSAPMWSGERRFCVRE